MQKRIYSTLVAALVAFFAVMLFALPAQAAQKKAVKPAHGKVVATKPHAKAAKTHGVALAANHATVKKGHKATASKPNASKHAGVKPALAAGKAPKKQGHAATRVTGRKAHASKSATASKVAVKKHAAKPRKVNKATH